jgi:membrane-associated protease RseP (regulator of RpoE activity)
MTEKRFSIWQVVGVLAVALVLLAASAGGGLALGYQWGRASGLAAARAGGAGGYAYPEGQEGQPPNLAAQPYLGVQFQTITAEIAKADSLPVTTGALVRSVVPAGPAAQAGVQAGDIVQKVGDQTLDAEHTLRDLVLAHKAGDEITLAILRGGATQSLTVKLSESAASPLPFEPGMGPGFHFQPPPQNSGPAG